MLSLHLSFSLNLCGVCFHTEVDIRDKPASGKSNLSGLHKQALFISRGPVHPQKLKKLKMAVAASVAGLGSGVYGRLCSVPS